MSHEPLSHYATLSFAEKRRLHEIAAEAQNGGNDPENFRPMCYGAQTSDSQPDCDGPDVREVSVVSPEAERPFTTHWCADCRDMAVVEQGCSVTILGD